jgi:transcription elongation factor GreB
MSRGFVREGDQEELPMVPQRAFLPAGVTNFVTKSGIDKLLAERDELIAERNNISIDNENEKRIAVNFINAKLHLLNDRISTSRVVKPEDQPPGEVRFGALVKLKNTESGKEQVFRIVGVDEAEISKGRVSFVSPLARSLMNRKVGDKVILKRDTAQIEYLIVEISYI